jgi:hypothetical protein
MANLSKLNAPSAPMIISTGSSEPTLPRTNAELARSQMTGVKVPTDKLTDNPYAAVTQADGTTMMVSPKATITEALGRNSKHPYAKPTAHDIAEQDKLIAEAGRDVEARHEDETNALLDIMRKKQPGVRTGGMIGIRR